MIQEPQHMGLGLEMSLRPRAFSASPVKWATSCGARQSERVCSTGHGQDCSPCARVSSSLKVSVSGWNQVTRSKMTSNIPQKSYRFTLFLQLTYLLPKRIRESSKSTAGYTEVPDCSKDHTTLSSPFGSPWSKGGVCLLLVTFSVWLCRVLWLLVVRAEAKELWVGQSESLLGAPCRLEEASVHTFLPGCWWSLFRALCCKRFSGYFPYNILEWVYFIVLFKRHDRKWWEAPVITVKCHSSL